MDFDLSPDQVALQEAARSLLDRYASVETVRARIGPGVVVGALATAPGASGTTGAVAPAGYDHTLWAAMADQGWLAVERPEAEGGLGLGMVEVAVLCEEVGRHVAPAPFLQNVLALDALTGVPELGPWVERLVAGASVAAAAWCSAPGALTVAPGSPPSLSGRPDPVVFGPSADLVVVVEGSALYAVEVEGDRPVPEPAMDRTREIGWLVTDGRPTWRLGGPEAVERFVNRAATGLSAELLGGASRALDMAVQYAKDRVQFGRPIGSFQAIKHALADALVDLEGMRSTVYYAAWCTATDDEEATLAASMAKSWCSDAARRIMATCLQVHGGIGFTWEHDLHLYLKRSQLDQVSVGDASLHRDRISKVLGDRLAEGRSVI